MNHWLMMFRPDTYDVVKERGVIGVLHMHRLRLAEVAERDSVIAYVSKRTVLDGVGRIARGPVPDLDPVFPGREPARELLWELDVWPSGASRCGPSLGTCSTGTAGS